MPKEPNYAKQQAMAQFKSISAMMKDWRKAQKAQDQEAIEHAEQVIHEDPLSVQVRDGWRNPGEKGEPEEFSILLCTGGPAVRIIGELDDYNEPSSAVIQYQDWGTPWPDWAISRRDGPQAIILDYCRCFYFSE